MQSIYNFIDVPDTHYFSMVHNVAVILWLQFLVATYDAIFNVQRICLFLALQPSPSPSGPGPPSFMRFLDHTQLRPTVGRTPLDE